MARGPWVKVDPDFPSHPKVMVAGERLGRRQTGRVLAVWLEGMCYTNGKLTKGYLPRDVVSRFQHDQRPLEVADALAGPITDAEAALWGFVVTGDPLTRRLIWYAVEGGWRVHDYDDWQGKGVALIEQRRESGRLGGLASAEKRRANARPHSEAYGEARAQARASAGAAACAEPDAEVGAQHIASELKHVVQHNFNHDHGTACFYEASTAQPVLLPCGKPVNTAPLTRGDAHERKTPKKPATLWIRVSAVARGVIRDLCDQPSEWSDEVKARCLAQGLWIFDARGFPIRTDDGRGAAIWIAAIASERFKAVRRGEIPPDHELRCERAKRAS